MAGRLSMSAAAVDLRLLVARLADRYEFEGRSWPALCAAVVLVRGRLGLDRAAFARRLGVPTHVVGHLEEGLRHPSLAPAGLAEVAPDVDWARYGVPRAPPAGHSRHACRARHPAARRPARVLVGAEPGQDAP
jgi:hypothetical protein